MHGKHKLTVPLIVITKKIEASLSIRKNFVYIHKLNTVFLCDSVCSIIPLHFIPHLYTEEMAVRKVCFSKFFSLPKHGLTCGSVIPLHLSTDVFEFWT